MNQAAISGPVTARKKKINPVFWALPVTAAVLGVTALIMLRGAKQTGLSGAAWHTVVERNVDVTVRKDGELQAVNNIDIISQVEGAVTITSIVKEGASVKKGDVLVELDSSAIRQRIDDTTLDVQNAEAAVVAAKEAVEIQDSQNKTNFEEAEVAREAAQIDLEKFTKGDYPQQLADAQAALQMAEINLDNLSQDFEQVQRLAAQGFLTPTDVEGRRVNLIDAQNKRDAAATKLNNLKSYDQRKNLATFRSALARAQQRYVRVQRENAAAMNQKQTDLKAKTQALMIQRRKLEKLNEQFAACTIKAPEDGLVVYATSGDRNAQSQIQEGTQVRERQMILRLPDTSRMKAVVRIQEAQVTRLREGQQAIVSISGVSKPITGKITKISVLADSSQRWWNPDLKEYPVDIELDETPAELKPGVGASAEIYIRRLENVVAVPISTIYGSGSKSYVFVKEPGGEGLVQAKPRVVELGMSSDTYVHVVKGLERGEEVLMLQAGQGRELLAKAGIAEEPATRPSLGGRRRGGGPGGGQGGGPGGQAVPGQGGAGQNTPGQNTPGQTPSQAPGQAPGQNGLGEPAGPNSPSAPSGPSGPAVPSGGSSVNATGATMVVPTAESATDAAGAVSPGTPGNLPRGNRSRIRQPEVPSGVQQVPATQASVNG